jgi:hypothetical protein
LELTKNDGHKNPASSLDGNEESKANIVSIADFGSMTEAETPSNLQTVH